MWNKSSSSQLVSHQLNSLSVLRSRGCSAMSLGLAFCSAKVWHLLWNISSLVIWLMLFYTKSKAPALFIICPSVSSSLLLVFKVSALKTYFSTDTSLVLSPCSLHLLLGAAGLRYLTVLCSGRGISRAGDKSAASRLNLSLAESCWSWWGSGNIATYRTLFSDYFH